jgi:DNA-binding LacI/PurR family transcriptional regulator
MKQMVTKLARFGYRRIGYISETPVMSNAYDRYVGFRLGIEENGLETDPGWVVLDPSLRAEKKENAYQLMQNLLSQNLEIPQILLCSSDLIAIGVMAALREKGCRVPKDVGVIGFDDISLAKFAMPPLTTVAQDMKQLGKISAQTLIQRIEHPEKRKVSEDIALGAKIVVRESARL